MIVGEWQGYLFVFIDKKVYTADSRQVSNTNNAYEYVSIFGNLVNK